MGKEYDGTTKAEVSVIALREELTTAEISKRYGIPTGVINRWRREAIEHIKNGFDKRKKNDEREENEQKIAMLERKVGQLTLDNEFLKKNYNKYFMKRG